MDLRRGGFLLGLALALVAAPGCKRTPKTEAPAPPAEPAPSAEPESAPLPESAPDAAPAAPAFEWETTSLRGTYVLRQKRTGPTWCRLECVRLSDSNPLWSSDTCLASPDQLVFVDEDGERIVVLEPRPAFEEGALLRAELGSLYLKGALQQRLKASAVLKDPDKLPRAEGRYLWLAGVRGETGRAPRLVPDGVQVRTLDDLVRTLRFDGTVQLDPTNAAGDDLARAAAPVDAGSARDASASDDAGDPAEAQRRARFKQARKQVAELEAEVEERKRLLASIEKDGVPEEAPRPRIYDPGMTPEQRDQSDSIAFLQYRKVIADHLDLAKAQQAEAEEKLRKAQEDLADLERKAGYEAVPFEWRK